MKICVIGGGNIGTLLAAEFAHKEYDVVIHSSSPVRWSDTLTVLDHEDRVCFTTGHYTVTDDLAAATSDADQIWITYPSFLFPKLGRKLLPLVRAGQAIVVVPGGGGAEFAFLPLIEKGCTLCGLQRVHSISRLHAYGKSVYMLGRKPAVQLAAIPAADAARYAETVSQMLDLPCEVLPNYLTVTLTPSNPILHTTRLYSMFRDYHEGVTYDHNFLFYEEWTDAASTVMLRCDEELQSLCRALAPLDLTGVRSLRLHYESDTPQKMTKKISGIPAFRGLTSPMKEVPGGWVPDFTSRYFTADFSYGLKVILDIGRLMQVEMPEVEAVWNWYCSVSGAEEGTWFCLPFRDPEAFRLLYQ